jgi:hypothetical protein
MGKDKKSCMQQPFFHKRHQAGLFKTTGIALNKEATQFGEIHTAENRPTT